MRGGEADGERARVTISVSDTGIGIAGKNCTACFRNLRRRTRLQPARYGGTGLGLAITKQLVDSMGGSIEVESSPGEGSRFALHLAAGFERLPASLAGLRALIVDDNELNRRVQEYVSGWYMVSGSYGTGKQALEEVRAATESGELYRFVIADFEMPD